MRRNLANEKIKIEVADRGAELKSLVCDGIEYIWYSDPKYWEYCSPFLFPVVGTLKNKETIFEDKLYKIRQHGLIRYRDFKYLGSKENEISFEFTSDDETKESYPYKFVVDVNYYLKGYEVKAEIIVKNIDEKDMLFCLGGHPAFNVPLYKNEKFTDYRVVFSEEENFDSPKVMPNATLNFDEPVLKYRNLKELPLQKEVFSVDTIINAKVKSKSVMLLNKENKGLKFSYPKFKTLAIWTPFNDAPFVCLEPWIGYNDRYNASGYFKDKDDVVTLKPNETFKVEFMIEVIK